MYYAIVVNPQTVHGVQQDVVTVYGPVDTAEAASTTGEASLKSGGRAVIVRQIGLVTKEATTSYITTAQLDDPNC